MTQSPRPVRPVSIEPPVHPRHNLPAPLTRFIGREGDVVALTALLATTRLLTLTGPGGCGKTRLALAVAEATCSDGPSDGVWLVEFAALTDPALVPQSVAAVLGVREEPRRPLLDTLTDALGTRSVLLLFDNCEHLVAPIAAMADTVLRACPDLRILATSREALRVSGEVAWRVPSLSLPEGRVICTSAQVAASEAAQLFADRVRLRQPAFALADENAAAVAAICRRLDGMPLALELAAARVRVLSLAQLEARLDDALRLLTVGERTAMPRHQTLRATLDWSYALLTEDERIVLRRLAVFAGGCDIAAAEAVCGGGGIAPADVLTLLAQLVEKSLVQMNERDGNARYRLLETVRQYAVERLDASNEGESVGQSHADWYLAIAERARPALDGTEQGKWMARLESDYANLRRVLRRCMEREENVQGLQMARDLARFWQARNDLSEGRLWLTLFLERCRREERSALQEDVWPDALFGAGRIALFQQDYEAARALFDELFATAKQSDDRSHLGFALNQLGHLAYYQRDFTTAHALYAEALAIRRRLGNPHHIAISLGSLGQVALLEDRDADACDLLEESVALFRQIGESIDMLLSLRWLGFLAIRRRDQRAARDCFAESLLRGQESSTNWGLAESLDGFAMLAAIEGQATRALTLAGAADAQRIANAAYPAPFWHEYVERTLAPSRDALGARVSADMENAGRAMTLTEAVTEAMAIAPSGTIPDSATNRRAMMGRYGGLSARERAVVAEVARGKANREIADALFVTEKTVEWHISNSLRKLSFRTRAQLAVWAVAVGLVASPHAPKKETPAP